MSVTRTGQRTHLPINEELSVAVRIRLKRLGRRHRPFFRICAMDARAPRDGRAIEELGHYDPMVPETDARAILKSERIDYWLGVGAQPTEKVAVLIRKYGSNGSHVEQQQQALQRLSILKPKAPPPTVVPRKAEQQPEPSEPAPSEPAPSEPAPSEKTPSEETPSESAEAAAVVEPQEAAESSQ